MLNLLYGDVLMKITKTFNDKMAVKLLESENLTVGSIETSQKKPYVLAEIVAIDEKSELNLKVGDKVYLDTEYQKVLVEDEVYIVSEKAIAYM